jgi:hypothetical protein
MTLPAILLALLAALVIGALYHFLRGGNGWRLLLYLGLSSVGFAAGQLIGAWRGWSLFLVGSINLGMGTIGSLIFLIGGEWLSRIDAKKETGV